MPFTFFAHQLPVLPIARRWHNRFDGLALVTGSMAPDLSYALLSTPLAFDSHSLLAQLWWSMPTAALLAIVIRRSVIKPTALAVPDCGPFHLHDYQLIANHQRQLVVTLYSALLGALTHIGLDSFTHHNGYVVKHWSVLQNQVSILGYQLPTWHFLQYLGGSLGSLLAVLLLALYGHKRWLRRPLTNNTKATAKVTVRRPILIGVAAGVSTGFVVSALSILIDDGAITAFMRFIWITFFGLLIGSATANKALENK